MVLEVELFVFWDAFAKGRTFSCRNYDLASCLLASRDRGHHRLKRIVQNSAWDCRRYIQGQVEDSM